MNTDAEISNTQILTTQKEPEKKTFLSIEAKTKLHEKAKQLVNDAIKNKTVFCIQGRFPVIRYMLKKKGWLEKDLMYCMDNVDPYLTAEKLRAKEKDKDKKDKKDEKDKEKEKLDEKPDSDDEPIEDFKLLDKDLQGHEFPISQADPNSLDSICARLLKDVPANFFWVNKTQGISYKNFGKSQIMNKLPNCNIFTTKSGILDVLRDEMLWACDDKSVKFFPRCYKLSNPDEKIEFLEDYKFTAAICVLKIFINHLRPKRKVSIQDGQESGAEENNDSPRQGHNQEDPSESETLPESNCTTPRSPRTTPRTPRTKADRENYFKEKMKKQTVELAIFEKALKIIKDKQDLIKAETFSYQSRDEFEITDTLLNSDELNSLKENCGEQLETYLGSGMYTSQSSVDHPTNSTHGNGFSFAAPKAIRDNRNRDPTSIISEEDKMFYNNFYKLAYYKSKFEKQVYQKYSIHEIEHLLDECVKLFPDMQLDILDWHNLWIIKPGAKSRGRGITVMSKLFEILKAYVSNGEPNLQKDSRWIIQKYIGKERPLLIHQTKFDIRQWFLIDNWSPLKVYVYKDSYLRFSSRKFSLDNLNSAVHLCNYSIQKNFDTKANDVNTELPEDNMWVNAKFDQWFYEKYNVENVWEEQIWPQMVNVLEKILLSTQQNGSTENAPRLKGFFELYGADFMLSIDDDNENCDGEQTSPKINVWMIEINSCPSMALSSSQATHNLCRNVMEDTVDLALHENRHQMNEIGSKVGKFILGINSQTSQVIPKYTGKDLNINGTEIKKPYVKKPPRVFRIPESKFSNRRSLTGANLKATHDELKKQIDAKKQSSDNQIKEGLDDVAIVEQKNDEMTDQNSNNESLVAIEKALESLPDVSKNETTDTEIVPKKKTSQRKVSAHIPTTIGSKKANSLTTVLLKSRSKTNVPEEGDQNFNKSGHASVKNGIIPFTVIDRKDQSKSSRQTAPISVCTSNYNSNKEKEARELEHRAITEPASARIPGNQANSSQNIMPTLPFLLRANEKLNQDLNPNSINMNNFSVNGSPSNLASFTNLSVSCNIPQAPGTYATGTSAFNHSFKINGSIQRNRAIHKRSRQRKTGQGNGGHNHKFDRSSINQTVHNTTLPNGELVLMNPKKINKQRSEILNGYLNEIMSDLATNQTKHETIGTGTQSNSNNQTATSRSVAAAVKQTNTIPLAAKQTVANTAAMNTLTGPPINNLAQVVGYAPVKSSHMNHHMPTAKTDPNLVHHSNLIQPKPPTFNRGSVSITNQHNHSNHAKTKAASQVSVVDMSNWLRRGRIGPSHGFSRKNLNGPSNLYRDHPSSSTATTLQNNKGQHSFPVSTATIGSYSRGPNYVSTNGKSLDGRNIQRIGDYLLVLRESSIFCK